MHQRINITIKNSSILYFSRSTIDKSFKPSFHSHPNLELLLFTGGQGKIITAYRKLDVKKGDIVVINPNSRHYEEGEGLSFFAIGIRNLDLYLQETFTKKIIVKTLSGEDYSMIYGLYSIIYHEATTHDSFSSKIIENSEDTIFRLLDRLYNLTGHNSSDVEESDVVSNIKNIIDTYYASEITLDEIAHRLSESKSTICHKFKNETGMSIIEYKINRQLEEAKNMLSISDMSVSNIASLTGFSSASYFTKLFREHYGITPKQHKERIKNGQQ